MKKYVVLAVLLVVWIASAQTGDPLETLSDFLQALVHRVSRLEDNQELLAVRLEQHERRRQQLEGGQPAPEPGSEPPTPVPPPQPGDGSVVPYTPTPSLYELPQVFLDTRLRSSSGATRTLAAGGDLQAALDEVACGDALLLDAGAVFEGNFKLRKSCQAAHPIVVRSAASDAELPREGQRISPAFAQHLPKIRTPNSFPAIETVPGASGYRLMFLDVGALPSVRVNWNLVYLNRSSNIVVDRSIVSGHDQGNFRRGVTLNGSRQAVIESYISKIHEVGADSQAIGSWSGRGPFKIVNNYLEGAGENIMFGGAPSPRDVVPSDIEIRLNHLFKPLSWRKEDSSYAGTPWTVKNLLELKNARRVLIEGNVLENNWVHAQSGFAVLFTPRAHSSTASWTVVEDVTFRFNVVKNSFSGFNLLARDWPDPSQPTVRIAIRHNLVVLNPNHRRRSVDSLRGLQFTGNGVGDYTFEHNTLIQPQGVGAAIFLGSYRKGKAQAKRRFSIRNNIGAGRWFLLGGTLGEGIPAIRAYLPDGEVSGNVMVGMQSRRYPEGNFFPSDWQGVGLVDFYTLQATSPLKGAGSDGKDVGADINELNNKIQGVVQ